MANYDFQVDLFKPGTVYIESASAPSIDLGDTKHIYSKSRPIEDLPTSLPQFEVQLEEYHVALGMWEGAAKHHWWELDSFANQWQL